MGQLATCTCRTWPRPCDRLATEEDLLCDVCRGICDPFFYVDAPANRITTWVHQNDDTIAILAKEIEQGRMPAGGETEQVP